MRTTKYLLFTALTAAVLLSVGCARQFNSVWVLYEESYCADPWGVDFEDDDAKFKAVKDYLEASDIRAFKVEAGTGIEKSVCNSCECGNGEVLRAKVHEDDRQAVVAAGWYVEK
ncbi:MAG: hypothetical protein HQ500_05915 [Flavobacteriales bacterium]|nr:hypothetical protein [Flavobacteriales bacterium]